MSKKISRLHATKFLVEKLSNEFIIASLGNPSFDLFYAKDRGRNFYTWGCMGLASSIGLGLALQVKEKVIVLDGDGSILMNLGSFTTIATQSPPNLIHIIWDNEQHQITGKQPTATAKKTRLAEVAKAAGIKKSYEIVREEEFEELVVRALQEDGPWVLVAKIDSEGATGRPSRDPVLLKHKFMGSL